MSDNTIYVKKADYEDYRELWVLRHMRLHLGDDLGHALNGRFTWLLTDDTIGDISYQVGNLGKTIVII